MIAADGARVRQRAWSDRVDLSAGRSFVLPAQLEAREPPEARGLRRDGVRLMVASRAAGAIEHARFSDLTDYLSPGDLLVVNVSATLPAACDATRADGRPVRVHFSTRVPELDSHWRAVELRSPDGSRPERGRAGECLELAGGGGTLELVAPYASSARLLLARHADPVALEDYLWDAGWPITYGHLRRQRRLSEHQNVYASVLGSSEAPSAGRPFTSELITRLVAGGVLIAPLVLHAGVSSPERHEPPFPEYYEVSGETARLVAAVRGWGGRVIAVGTTVVRALESSVDDRGELAPSSGWTNLMITPDRTLHAVDGLITGWHEPEASHLLMLEALAGRELLERSYAEALEHGYLWHEFGDSHLILP
jgi:S-adenosylmethionine:tRNA ribosyltransferase-isomerase